jgi:chloroplast NAD(P)H dehydrogenase
MVTLCHSVHTRASGKIGRRNAAAKVFCSTQMPPSQITIKVLWVMTLWIFFSSSTVTCSEGKIWWYIEKVVIIGATREIGRTAIVAVSKARGMELAGAIDSQCVGLDAGEVLTIH